MPSVSFVTDPPGRAIHVQRKLRADEIERLPAEWCAIEAVDELGPTIRLNDYINRRRGN